ncbi:MAG: hypothetical protein H6739_07580 [Alphaproteobacteria bacterium]|nr:hypothetical protein [Alphaproteobacteria bacterium]
MSNANWMEQQASTIGAVPLRELVLPGTHDSGTYSLNADSPLAPDGGESYGPIIVGAEILGWVIGLIVGAWAAGEITSGEIANLSRAQSLTIYEQLQSGIRYLDIRFCVASGVNLDDVQLSDIYICHGMLGPSAPDVLQQIQQFLAENPKEVVLVDINHVYNWSASAGQALVDGLGTYFGQQLVPADAGLDVTLNQLWGTDQRLIVFCVDPNALSYANGYLWPQSNIESTWHKDAEDLAELGNAMLGEFSNSKIDGKFWVNQGIISPASKVAYVEQGSLESIAEIVTPAVTVWVQELFANLSPSLNIVIVNFCELAPFVEACRAVNQEQAAQNLQWLYLTTNTSQSSLNTSDSLYVSTNAAACGEGQLANGVQIAQSSSFGLTPANQIIPVVRTGTLDPATPSIDAQPASVDNENYVQNKIGKLQLDTTPVLVPEGCRLVGLQLATSTTAGLAQPALVVQELTVKGTPTTVVTAVSNPSVYPPIQASKWYVNTQPLVVPGGVPIRGFRYMTSNQVGCAITNQILPSVCVEVGEAPGLRSSWLPASVSAQPPGGIKESSGTAYMCPGADLMVGMKHSGDENGTTWYYVAPVSVAGNTVYTTDVVETTVSDESAGVYVVAAQVKRQVMVGRQHSDDENGSTTYWFANLYVAGQPDWRLVMGPPRWSAPQKQSSCDFKCPPGFVLTGRQHRGDENGNTVFEYAPIYLVAGGSAAGG